MQFFSDENARIENFLCRKTNAPKALFLKLLRKKKIRLNDKVAHIGSRVSLADKVELDFNIFSNSIDNVTFSGGFTETKDFFIINKPYNICSQGGNMVTKSLDKMMISFANLKNENSFITHRLDKTTTGAMIFAKSTHAAQKIMRCFQNNMIKKIYFTILEGNLKKEKLVNTPILGKDAVSLFVPIFTGEKTFCMVFMRYGRKHQIRLHASIIGHPLFGDEQYGGSRGRIFLHCFFLSFLRFSVFSHLPEYFYIFLWESYKKTSFGDLLNIYNNNTRNIDNI